jgi:uncharacterized protein YaaQ
VKLVLAILQDRAEDPVTKALTTQGFRVTAIASTGGFLKQGMTTLIIGVEDTELEKALTILRSTCTPVEPGKKCAKLFVLQIQDSIHF